MTNLRKILEELWNLGFLGKDMNKSIKETCENNVNEAHQQILALIENRLPKEKYVDREENPLKDYGEQIGFNACLSEIKKEMGI